MKSFSMAPRERILVGLTIVGLCVLTYTMGYQKQLKEAASLQSQLATQIMDVEKKQNSLKDLEEQNEALNRILSSKSQFRKYIETSKYMAELLRQLGARDTYKDSNLNLRSINIKETAKISNFSRSTFQLEIESSFIELGRYLASLEASDLLVEVQSVKLFRIDNELKRCIANIEVHGYHNKEAGL